MEMRALNAEIHNIQQDLIQLYTEYKYKNKLDLKGLALLPLFSICGKEPVPHKAWERDTYLFKWGKTPRA